MDRHSKVDRTWAGDIFKISATTSSWDGVVYSFPNFLPNVSLTASTLIFDQAGNLYGTTQFGGLNQCEPINIGCGTVFELQPTASGWREIVLYKFSSANAGGYSPTAGLVFDTNGNLYGTTAYGGTGSQCAPGNRRGCGTIFKLTANNGTWQFSTLYNFTGATDGAFPSPGSLVLDASGNIYGTTEGNSSVASGGTVYEFQP